MFHICMSILFSNVVCESISPICVVFEYICSIYV